MASGLVQFATSRHLYYGWVIVATLAITETVSWGILFYAFSAILTPMGDDLGWSTATITGAFSLGLLIAGLAAPFVGGTIDRHGPRIVMTAGSVLGVIALIAWSVVDAVWSFYLVWACIGLTMSATLYEPAFTTVTAWFERDRPRAILAITLLAGFASTIFLPITALLESRFEWRSTLVILAAMLGLVTVPAHVMVLRRRPEDHGLFPDGAKGIEDTGIRSVTDSLTLRDALRDRAFWWMAIAFSLETFATIAVGVHLIPYLTERGDGARFAAIVTGLIGAAQVLARIAATMLGGRISDVHLTALIFAMQSVAIIVLILWQSPVGVLTAVLLLGSGRGAVTLMRPSLIVKMYGREHFGVISGSLAMFLTGARALGPVGAGVAYLAVGGYVPVFWAMAALSMVAAFAMIPVQRLSETQAGFESI